MPCSEGGCSQATTQRNSRGGIPASSLPAALRASVEVSIVLLVLIRHSIPSEACSGGCLKTERDNLDNSSECRRRSTIRGQRSYCKCHFQRRRGPRRDPCFRSELSCQNEKGKESQAVSPEEKLFSARVIATLRHPRLLQLALRRRFFDTTTRCFSWRLKEEAFQRSTLRARLLKGSLFCLVQVFRESQRMGKQFSSKCSNSNSDRSSIASTDNI
ncbi:hypothetical protein EYF80_004431 [Liparis tanakae]|uniref:Uncharacterized protein n=1 Tax=Liparis tanakae TaxID=230148 RepID=A0A4Z2J5C3_9TELE|nr:hypothetical protein EYF80_004431 [Liparis tanakae]